MSRRGSDVGLVQVSDQMETISNIESDSPREVVIDDHLNPSPVVPNGISKDADPPPPPPLILHQTPSKTNGINGNHSSPVKEDHKCTGCSFTTPHLPDLLEHNRSCPSQKTEPSRSVQQKPAGQPVGSKCNMCTQVFANLEDQIKHMTDYHKLKASFKCSFCRMSFSSKEMIEAHIKTHNKSQAVKSEKTEKQEVKKEEKIPDPEPIRNDDNEDSITEELEEVDCLVCGKSFKDPVEHREHEAACAGPEDPKEDILDDGDLEEYPEYFSHFKHDHINLVTDPDNPYCKGCDKTMGSVLGICNHLSRRHDCREWYCRNLSKEIKKADEVRKSQGLPPPEPLPTRMRGPYARRSNASSGSHSNSPLPQEDHLPKRAASLLAQTHMRVASKGQIVEGYDDKTRSPRASAPSTPINKRPEGPHSIQCTNCNKVFDGRSPHVGFTNHQRGSQDCREKGTRRFITPRMDGTFKSVPPSPLAASPSKSRRRESPSVVELDDDDNNKSGTQYFYCKICNDGDPKTRTSLGCHLTVHHGLPPVNCKNGVQDAFRCQTCCQMFNSKHYYNQHRHDCDLKSEYVGFCASDAKPGPPPKRSRARTSAPAAMSSTVIAAKGDGSDLSCELCGKTGFVGPNNLRIHTKYICVNRSKPEAKNLAKGAFLAAPKVPKLKIKTSTITQSPLETRSTRYRDSIPQNSDSSGNEMKRSSKTENLKCNDCGRGPYTNVHHLMEHQNNYCQALKRNQNGKRESLQDDIDQIRHTRSAKKIAVERTPVKDDVDTERKNGDSSIECLVCGINFEGLEKFVKHRLNHASNDLSGMERMKCEICLAKVFSCMSDNELKLHFEEHLSNKLDHSGSSKAMAEPKPKIQDVLQRSLLCAVCNSQSKTYEEKVSHERKCRDKFLKIVTCSICQFQANNYDEKVAHERKCLDSFMAADDEPDVKNSKPGNGRMNGSPVKNDDEPEDVFAHFDTDEKKMGNLRKLFKELLHVLDIKSEAEAAEEDCRRILRNLGEEPLGANAGSSPLESFRSNIGSLVRLVIKNETLECAYEDAGTVDEALYYLLQNPNELQ